MNDHHTISDKARNSPCPYCGKRHRGDPVVKAIQCKYHWQNREYDAMLKAQKTLFRLEDEEEDKVGIEEAMEYNERARTGEGIL